MIRWLVKETSHPWSYSRWLSLTIDDREIAPELLEQIFVASGNGNLLPTCPRSAAKLSGSDTVRKRAFLVAFYPCRLLEVAELFSLDTYILTPVPGRKRYFTGQSVMHMRLGRGFPADSV